MGNQLPRESPRTPENTPIDRHHGGQELPDDVQDRPEQNAGYDAAVRGNIEPASTPLLDVDEEPLEDLNLEDLDSEEAADPDAVDRE